MEVSQKYSEECNLKKEDCKNLILRTSTKGNYVGQMFFGCKEYPVCKNIIPLHFDQNLITENQEKLAIAFQLFVQSNNFLEATYGVVFFNLRQASFRDYLLCSDIVKNSTGVETGLTGAKIYDELFYYLYLIPSIENRQYLISNFPKSYQNFLNTKNFHRVLLDGIDYEKHIVDEVYFSKYREIENYNQ